MKVKVSSPTNLHVITYDSLANLVRASNGKKRLSPTEAQMVRDAVDRHNARQAPIADEKYVAGRYAAMHREKVARRVHRMFYRHYRTPSSRWVGGDTDVEVVFVDAPTHVGARAISQTVWHKRHTWSGKNLAVRICIPKDWHKTVEAAGLAEAGGMLTLAAEPLSEVLWSAVWLRQGRGFEVIVEHGYIVRRADGTYYHTRDLRRASREADTTLRVKITSQDEVLASLTDMTPAEIIERYGDMVVTARDSIRGGNCREGTAHWVEHYAGGRRQGTVAELLQIAPQPSPYILRAIAAAIVRRELEAQVGQWR